MLSSFLRITFHVSKMTEQSTIQCENCGTIYPDTDEVCPYCGAPQPLPGPYYDGPYYDDEGPLEEEFYAGQDDALPDEGYLPPTPDVSPTEEYADEYPVDGPYVEDDIFAIAGEETDQAEYDDEYDELYDEYEDEFDEAETEPRRLIWPRLLFGCLGILLCIGLFYGGIGLFAAYQGLQEQALANQTEAEEHYQRGQQRLANNEIELAIAEFERALTLNPNLLPAREALHEAQRIAQSLPTPTSETRTAAATALLNDAETQISQENWSQAVETLVQLRDLDPDYQAAHVSELIYQTNYQLGLTLITPDQIDQALLAFEQALAERPDDEVATQQKAKASLYLEGKTAVEQNDSKQAVESFHQLYQQDDQYLDVKQRLLNAYVKYGDGLAVAGDWCLAEVQYVEAILLQPDNAVKTKSDQSHQRCLEMASPQAVATSPPVRATSPTGSASGSDRTATPAVTATLVSTATTSPGSGSILFSAFNPNEARWEIMSISARGGAPEVLVTNATMPALSANGKLLVYHSELLEAEGFHLLDLTSGEERRITNLKWHILPRWGGDNQQFLFVAQEPATQRWQVHLGFADGKSEPVTLRDGRTADWSSASNLIAYQGTDAEGNNPGIYLIPFDGGESSRLTNHESDRAPAFSPDGSQLAFMSTRNGNWDIYTVSAAGSAPRQITTSPGNDGLPAWSPDGSQIAYVSDADGSWAIYVIDAAGGTPFRVTEWDGSNRSDWLLAQIWWAQ
jgi:tetratricopeptide (TPR) repeat protein